MKDPTGRLQIHLRRQPGGLAVAIQSSRLTGASQVFIGKTLADTARTLPGLFSVCATAQAAACASAAEMALGLRPSPRLSEARRLLVDAETAREHLWRILLDWPGFLGEGPLAPAMAQVMGAYGRLRGALMVKGDPLVPGAADLQPDGAAADLALTRLTAVAAQEVLGQEPGDWLASHQTAPALRHWAQVQDSPAARMIRLVLDWDWGALGRSPVPVLPPLAASDLETRLHGPGAEAFIAAPLWRGGPAESTPFARQLGQPLVAELAREGGNGLLPRLAAQLVELASLLAGLSPRLAALLALAEPEGEDRLIEGTATRRDPLQGLAAPAVPKGEETHAEADASSLRRGPAPSLLAPTKPEAEPGGAEAAPPRRDPRQGSDSAAALPAGVGLAQVQAARGLLVHRLAVADGLVRDYRILAPTEWNFHPQGAAALGLAALPARDEATLRRQAGLFITALDPCVAYDIVLG